MRDFAQVNEASVVTRDSDRTVVELVDYRGEVTLGALELLEIDACGFDKMDRAILDTLAAAMSTSPTFCRRGSLPAQRAAASPRSVPIRI